MDNNFAKQFGVLLAWDLVHTGYSDDCWMKEVHKILGDMK